MATMVDARLLLGDLMDDIVQIERDWKLDVIDPYASCYETAEYNFQQTLRRREEAERRKVEMAIMALSLLGGSVMTAVFVGTTATRIIGDAALNFICSRNLDRVFNMYAFLASRQEVGFLVGKLVKEIDAKVSEGVKARIHESAAAMRALEQESGSPAVAIRTKLDRFVTSCARGAHSVVQAIRDDAEMTAEGKIRAAELLLESPFYTSPRPIPTQGLAEEIELSLYLNLIVNSDYLDQYAATDWGANSPRYQRISSTPIQERPVSQRYPKSSSPTTLAGPYQRVRYQDMGGDIEEAVNRLSRSCLHSSSDFFPSNWAVFSNNSGKIVEKAHEALSKLSSKRIPAPVPPRKLT